MINFDEKRFLELIRGVIQEELTKAVEKGKDRLYTVKETCELLKISSRTLNRMTKAGQIRATKLRSRPAYEEHEIQRLLVNHKR
jgi:excisionase family DNA binding protein